MPRPDGDGSRLVRRVRPVLSDPRVEGERSKGARLILIVGPVLLRERG
jgi:hypothetical protein